MSVRPFEIEIHEHVAPLGRAHRERGTPLGPFFGAFRPVDVAGLDADDAVRAVVIAARGPHFTSGLDLVRMAAELGPALLEGGTVADRLALFRKVAEMRRGFDAIVESDKPFLAAVQGVCLGGGLDLLAACDIRLAGASARFSLRETKIAIVADMGSLHRLEAVIGRGHLRELAFTGKDIDAARARAIGLVNDVLATDEALLEAARAMAREIADNSPLVVQGTKRMLRFAARHGEAAGLEHVAAWNAAHIASEDLREAMSAFAAKRSPRFTGR